MDSSNLDPMLISGLAVLIAVGIFFWTTKRSGTTDSQCAPRVRVRRSNSRYSTIESGVRGERTVQEELRRLKGRIINGYITSENMFFDNQNFEIDFLVMVPDVGLVVAEVKNYSGQVYCTAGDEWRQVTGAGTEALRRNASRQVLRTRALLKKMLMAHGLSRWPIIPLVIFVHPEARIFRGKGAAVPQTDIITLSMFEGWLESQRRKKGLGFDRNSFNSLHQLIKAHEREYKAA